MSPRLALLPGETISNNGDQLVSADVPDRDLILLPAVEVGFRLDSLPDSGRRFKQGNRPAIRFDRFRRVKAFCCPLLERKHTWTKSSRHLLGQGVIGRRQDAAIQSPRNVGDPLMMKGVKYTRRHATPIVNGHSCNPPRAFAL
jgi:hypothetical protein